MKFSEVLRYADQAGAGALGPGAAQQEARRRFPLVAREHGLSVAKSARRRSGVARQVLVGVAAGYSVSDLELLDELAPALRTRTHERIELLDISGPEHAAALERLVPGSTATGQTPIVVVWDEGRRAEAIAGKAARDFLRSRYLGVDE